MTVEWVYKIAEALRDDVALCFDVASKSINSTISDILKACLFVQQFGLDLASHRTS
jgi:hypothetical protein